MKGFFYPLVRWVALALNLAVLAVTLIETRDAVARSLVRPVWDAGMVWRHPHEITYAVVFWAPMSAILALFWMER